MTETNYSTCKLRDWKGEEHEYKTFWFGALEGRKIEAQLTKYVAAVGSHLASIAANLDSKESLLEDALNHLLPQAYQKAISEQKIEAIAQPQIEVTQTDPVIFKAVVPLSPTAKILSEELPQTPQSPSPVPLSISAHALPS